MMRTLLMRGNGLKLTKCRSPIRWFRSERRVKKVDPLVGNSGEENTVEKESKTGNQFTDRLYEDPQAMFSRQFQLTALMAFMAYAVYLIVRKDDFKQDYIDFFSSEDDEEKLTERLNRLKVRIERFPWLIIGSEELQAALRNLGVRHSDLQELIAECVELGIRKNDNQPAKVIQNAFFDASDLFVYLGFGMIGFGLTFWKNGVGKARTAAWAIATCALLVDLSHSVQAPLRFQPPKSVWVEGEDPQDDSIIKGEEELREFVPVEVIQKCFTQGLIADELYVAALALAFNCVILSNANTIPILLIMSMNKTVRQKLFDRYFHGEVEF